MKYIFDFDDVLFNNTKQLKEHMYACLEEVGVSRLLAETYYKEVRNKEFIMKKFISALFAGEKINKISKQELYEKIMVKSKNFINLELVKVVKKIGKQNCYMVTHGNKSHQLDKIERTGLASLFSEIFIVQKSKKQSIEKICARHIDEEVVFIDDKAKRFEDLDFVKYPNLRTILYTEQDLSILSQS